MERLESEKSRDVAKTILGEIALRVHHQMQINKHAVTYYQKPRRQ